MTEEGPAARRRGRERVARSGGRGGAAGGAAPDTDEEPCLCRARKIAQGHRGHVMTGDGMPGLPVVIRPPSIP